ncbi:unnamed protein product [Closterium sp. NIES-64]|nr:unnamed protein product [Closterium sp. NIES-64]
MEAALGCRVRPRDAVGSAAPLAARRCPSGRSARAASSPDSLAPRPLLLRAALHPLQPRRHQLGASRLRLPQLGLRPPVSARRPHRPPSRVARAALVAESASSESRDNVTVTGDAEAQLRAASAAEGRAEEGGTVEWSRAWYAVGVTADMDATRPHAITVVGRPLVLWRDAAGSWRCFLDQCPHRLVALSEPTCSHHTCSHRTCSHRTCSHRTCSHPTCSHHTCSHHTCSHHTPSHLFPSHLFPSHLFPSHLFPPYLCPPRLFPPHLFPPHLFPSHLFPPHLFPPHLFPPRLFPSHLFPPHLFPPHLFPPHLFPPHLFPPHLFPPHLFPPHLFPSHLFPSHLFPSHLFPSYPIAPVPIAPVPIAPVPTTTVPITPVPTVPVPTASVPTAPVPTAPVPITPVPTAPVPTAPVPTAPVPAAPVPAAPVPTAPVPTAPVPTAPVPSHLFPPHLFPPHLFPPHLFPPHLLPPHLFPPHLFPSHLFPPHLFPSHLFPSHLFPLHLFPPHLFPPHLFPPQLFPSHPPQSYHFPNPPPPPSLHLPNGHRGAWTHQGGWRVRTTGGRTPLPAGSKWRCYRRSGCPLHVFLPITCSRLTHLLSPRPLPSARPQGRIDAEGRLACSYHGWAFAGSGACELIPQAAPEHPGQPPRAVCSPRACATAFPVREFHVSAPHDTGYIHNGKLIIRGSQGMLFVWPNEHSAQQAEATPLPLPHGVEWEEYEVLPHYTRRLAYGYEVLVENVVDLSHFPFAHHGVGMTTRDKGGPISNIGMTQSGVKGFEGPIDVFGFPTYLRFQAPQLVFYHSTPAAPQVLLPAEEGRGSSGEHELGAAAVHNAQRTGQQHRRAGEPGLLLSRLTQKPSPPSLLPFPPSPPPPKFPFLQRKAGANTSLVLLLYITPSAPGSSIVVQVNLVRPGDGKKLPSVPRWLRHIGLHQIYDGDSYFLHCQERVLQEREQQMEEARASKGEARQGGGAAEGGRSEAGGAGVVRGSAWRAFYMPTNADLPVVAFRQWLSKYAVLLSTINLTCACHSSVHNLLPPVHNLLPPVHNLLPPVHNLLPPVHNLLPPVHNLLPPVHNLLPPVHNLLPPVHNLLPPVHNLLPPVHNLLPPVHNLLPPVHNLSPCPQPPPPCPQPPSPCPQPPSPCPQPPPPCPQPPSPCPQPPPPCPQPPPPVHNLLPPVHNLLPPVHNLLPPFHNLLPPVHNLLPPVHNLLPPGPQPPSPCPQPPPPCPQPPSPCPHLLPPVHNLLPPVHNLLPPVHNLLPPSPQPPPPPVHNLLPPVHQPPSPCPQTSFPLSTTSFPLSTTSFPCPQPPSPCPQPPFPLSKLLPPVHNLLPPVHNLLPPVHNLLPPVHTPPSPCAQPPSHVHQVEPWSTHRPSQQQRWKKEQEQQQVFRRLEIRQNHPHDGSAWRLKGEVGACRMDEDEGGRLGGADAGKAGGAL